MKHWLFGYGSLIWRADFPYHERRPAAIFGWVRRFWQGSHDHRGTPDSPGRVVTLVPQSGTLCAGIAYQVAGDVFEHLDHREKNGYERVSVDIHLHAEGERARQVVPGVTYIARPGNEAFLGPADPEQIAAHIARSSGPSGSNADYLLELAASLEALNVEDRHVTELAARVAARRQPGQ